MNLPETFIRRKFITFSTKDTKRKLQTNMYPLVGPRNNVCAKKLKGFPLGIISNVVVICDERKNKNYLIFSTINNSDSLSCFDGQSSFNIPNTVHKHPIYRLAKWKGFLVVSAQETVHIWNLFANSSSIGNHPIDAQLIGSFDAHSHKISCMTIWPIRRRLRESNLKRKRDEDMWNEIKKHLPIPNSKQIDDLSSYYLDVCQLSSSLFPMNALLNDKEGDEELLVTGSFDSQIKIWFWRNNEQQNTEFASGVSAIRVLQHSSPVVALCVARQLLWSSAGQVMYVHTLDGTCVERYYSGNFPDNSVCLRKDVIHSITQWRDYVVLGTSGKVELWCSINRVRLASFHSGLTRHICEWNGDLCLAGNGEITIYSHDPGNPNSVSLKRRPLPVGSLQVTTVVASTIGNYLYSVSSIGELGIWEGTNNSTWRSDTLQGKFHGNQFDYFGLHI